MVFLQSIQPLKLNLRSAVLKSRDDRKGKVVVERGCLTLKCKAHPSCRMPEDCYCV